MLKKKSIVICFSLIILSILAGTGCELNKTSNGRTINDGQSEPLFDYRQIELDNGMQVVTLEDFSCPIAAVQVWYHVGSKNEDPERQGFAHMFEHMMFKGTDRVGPKDHFESINRVGGDNNAYTSYDQTVYIQTLPAEQIELALWLEAERMNFLKIDQEAFDTERQVVEEELRMGENRPYGRLYKKMMSALFKEHPYRWAIIGNIADLRAASVAELRQFWTRYYVPNNATLVIVGAIKHKEAQKLAEEYFGWIPRSEDPPRVSIREPEQTEAKTVVIDDENAPAGLVLMNWRTVPTGHKEEYVFDLLSEILGGGNSSRLYRELVAEKQMAVSASASNSNLEHDGIFGIDVVQGPGGADSEAILEVVKKHIEKIKTEGVSDDEMEKARNQILKSLVTANLRIERKARMLGMSSVIAHDTSRVNRMLDDIKSITKEQLQEVAKKYLTNERSTTFIVKQNTEGMLAGEKDKEDVPVTAEREEVSPKPGRAGVERPEDFPAKAPFAKSSGNKAKPKYSQKVLDNGLKVMVVPNHEVPFVTIQLGFMSGAWTESKPGSAAMAMDMLTKGTANYSEAELAEELERNAIGLGGFAEMDTCSVSGNCLKDKLGLTMKLMEEIVLQPSFDSEEFEKLRKQVITGLEIDEQSPQYLVDKVFRQKLYGQHPYSRKVSGELDDVKALKVEDLKEWWQKFIRPDEATLIFAGDIKPGEAVKLAKKTFGAWEASTAKPKMKLPEFEPVKKTHIYVLDKPGSMQSQIKIGQFGFTRKQQPDYFISRVVNNYFGGSFNSRLNDTIRVQKGLTYGARGGYGAGRFGGSFEMGTFTKNASTAETVQVMLDEVKRLQNEEPNDKELNDSIGYITGSFVQDRETPQQVAGDLWLIESQGLKSDYLDRLLDKVRNTTKDECISLAKKTLDADKMIIVVVGDASKIADDLKAVGPVTVLSEQES